MSRFLRFFRVLFIAFACVSSVILFRNVFAAGTGTTSYTYTLNDDGAKIASVPHSWNMGSVTQLSSLPYKPGYGYGGHYTGTRCTGNRIIDYQGNVLISLNESTTLYACWRPMNPHWNSPIVVLNDAGGSGGAFATPCSDANITYNLNGNYVSYGARGDWATIDTFRSGDYWWIAACARSGGGGELTTMAVTPTRSGYVFRGYYTGQNGTGTQVVYANGNMVDTSNVSTLSSIEPTTIYAYWTVDNSGNYLITLNDAGGSGSQVGGNAFLHLYEIYGECYASAISQNSSGTLSGSECIQAIYATPTRTGYNFGGYYTGQNGTGQQIINAYGTIVGSNTYFTAPATIYAKWTPKVLTVTLNHNSPSNSPSPSTVYLKYATGWYSNPGATTSITNMATVPTKTNYTFAGYWTTNASNGGVRIIDADGHFETTSAALQAFSANGTAYARWVANSSNPTPVWVTVTINDQSATTNSQPTVLYRNTNTAVSNCSGYKASQLCDAVTVTSITPPTKTNYTYGGHYTGTGGSGTQWTNANGTILYNVTANTTVYAKWTSNSGTIHTITLSPNGGTGSRTIYERYNVGWFRKDGTLYYQITSSIFNNTSSGGAGLTKPTRTNYTFNGYWDASSGGNQIIDADGYIIGAPSYNANKTFYAQWVAPSTSKIKLNPNNGVVCSVDVVEATFGQPMPTVSCPPTRTNYVFTGYFDAASGGTQYYTDELQSARNWDKTGAESVLYAHWEAIPTYNIVYYCDKEGAPSYTDTGIYFGQDYMFKTRAAVGCSTLSGKKFMGWTDDEHGSSILYQPGQIAQYPYQSDARLVGYNLDIGTVTLNHDDPDNTPSPSTVYYVPSDAWYSDSNAMNEITEMTTVPVKYGYEFLGYYTASSGGTKIIDENGEFINHNYVPSGTTNFTLYAHYSAKKYPFILDDASATTASSPNSVTYKVEIGWVNNSTNTEITSITIPTKTGNSFAGFWTGPNGTGTKIINADGTFVTMTSGILQEFDENNVDTLYAKWNPKNTVTFSCENQAGDGSGTPSPATVQVADGETLTFPSMANCSWGNAGYSPFLWGYVVNGGFTDTHDAGDTITWDSSWGDRTYNMWYAPSYFNYEYSCGAGTGTPPTSGNTYYHSNWTTAANTCTKEGYSFAGWLEPVSGVTYAESTMPTNGNVAGWLWPYDVIASAGGAFTAQWTANTYTIAYTLNGGTAGANAPTSGTYDSVVNISNPTHAHATFTGWTIAGMDNGVTHYYGTSNPPTSTTTGTSITTPTKATYYKNLRSVSGTVTFTAVWECNAGYTGTNCNTQVQYPLTWSCGDASGTPSGASFPTTITYGGTLTFPSNPCGSIVGHTFTGWVVDVNATQYNVGNTLTWPFTSGSAITAHYDPVKVNITYSCGGTGTTGSPSKTADNNIDYGSQVTLATLGTCAKAGNTATKWVVSGTNDNYDFGANVTHWNYTENKTLVPNWSAQSYNIIYKDEDGTTVLTGLTPSSYTYGTSTTINAVPTKLHSVFNGWCTGYNTSTKTPTGCTNTNTPLVIGPTETGIKTFYASWSCDAGYIKYADADLYEYIEYGVSDAQSYKARDCAPGYFHLYCNAHGGVACLEQFTINNKTYHFGEVYNTQAIRNSGMYGLLVSGNPVAVSSGTGGALFGHSNSYSVFGLCLASGFPNCNDLLDANATYSDWLDALASATGTTWGRAHHTFNGLWSQETGGTQYLAPNTPLAAMGYEANNNMNLPTLFTSDATLHAQWIPDVYTILLEAEGYDGTLPAVYETYNTGWSQTLAGTPGAWVQLTAAQMASKPGYTLLGYYSTASGTGTKYINGDGTLASGVTPTTFGESTTLHARFQANTYNVTYLCGTDATGTAPASATATYDTNFTPASIGGCTNPGRSFAGWLVSNTGNPSDTKQAGTAFQWKYTEDKTFTAQWTDNTYTITFHPGSGVTTTGTTEVQEWYSHAYRVQTSGSMSWTAVTEITLPTKTGYTFAGYYDNASFTGNPVMTNATLPVTTPAATYFTADADLYAKWTKTGYTVTYKNGGGTGNDVVQDVSYDTQFTTKPGSIFTKTNSVVTKWNTTSGGNYPNLNSNYTYSTAGNTVLTANWGACTCTKGTHVASCDVTGVANNTCQYSYTCEAGYNNAGATSGTFNGTANTATNASPNCGGANSYTITVTAGNGISKVTASGWTNSGTATMTKTFDFGEQIDLSTVVTATQKSGYTGAAYTVTNGAGSISGNVYTVGAGNDTITVSATGITTPAGVTITGGTTKVYNLSATTLTGATTTTYDSGITVKYSFGYAPSSNGTYGNWTTASTTETTSIAKDAFLGTRYYKVRVTASDGTLTSTTTTATTPTTMTLDQKKITFDATTNGGTLSGTSPLYVRYDSANVYTGAASTTTGTVPTASKTGYTFNGWYTAQTGGSQIYNASGTLTSATVSGWTGSSKWRATEDKTLYAQFSANTNTPYKVYHYTKNLTGTGYTLNGAVDNLTGTSNASVTLESLARALPGFTYDAGFEGTATHGTTKPSSGAVTTTTILPDGTRVIDLYYNRNSYTITYKNGGGTGSDVTQPGISYMGSFTTKPGTTFTKTNSIMTGWNTTSGGNYPLLDHTYSEYDTTGDTVLTAAWATCGCTPGTGVASCTTSATATNTCAATVTCASGYDQSTATWSCSGASCSSSCSADDFEITLNNANATTNGTAKIYTTYGVNVYLDANRSKVMTTSANPITKPERVYTVTYNGNNGTVGTTTAANTTATYTFKGYYSAATNGTQYIVGSTGRITSNGITTGKGYSANATWYAQWTYASVTLPNATRAGYTFAGWYDNATGGNLIGAAGATYTPTEDKTLYAHWNECTAGNYCDGTGTVTSCNTATNGKYPHSAAGSTSINDCYLTTTAGKYVATAGAGEVQCVANDYCAGGVNVYYGGTHSTTHPTNGGNASCSSGTNNKYNYSEAGTGTVDNCYLTLTTGKYVATAGAGMTNCAANNYSDDTTTKIYYGGTASSSHPTTSSCAACSTLGGGLYNKSAGGTGSTGCYVTTTAGKYIIENTNTAQTTCPVKKYCESATIYWPNVGQIADCPVADTTTAMTSYPSNYYNPTLLSISNQAWSTGITSINGCMANYSLRNARGDFTVESVKYNSTSGKYDNGGSKYYRKINAGYYGNERYSATYCDTATHSMIYKDALPCPAGSYCPGLTSMPLCSSGTYAETIGLYPCPTNYPDSAAMSTSINACYLTTTAGKYVATAGAGEVQCTANNYCTGGVVVHYDEIGGITACSTGAGSNYATSAAGSDSNTDCYKTVTLDKNGGSGTIQGTSGTNPASVVCHYNTECNFGSASGLTQTGYTFSGGWGTTNTCSGTTVKFTVPNDTGTYYACKSGQSKTCDAGYYLKADNATCTACPAGKYCVGGTFTFNGSDQGISGDIAAGYYADGCAKTSTGAVCSTSYHGGMVSGGYYSTGGGTSSTPTAAGNGCLSGNTCGKLSAPYYSNGGSKANDGTCVSGQTCGTCDSNYRANTTTGKTAVTQCQTQCAAGRQVATANAACSTPSGSWYTAQHLVNYGSKSSDTSNVVKACATNYATANTTTQTDHDAQSDCKRTITLDKNGGTGTVNASVVCSEGVACDLPDASGLNQTGYTFAGSWSTTSGAGATGCVSTVTTPTSGTYYACKSANTITIKLNKNGGTGTCGGATGVSDGTLTCTYDGSCTAPAWDSTTCNINNGSKIFTGWNTASDGGGTSYAPGASIQNIIGSGTTTIYAVWSDVTCNVTNGSGTASNTTTNTPVCAVTCTNGYSKTGYMNATTTFNVTGNVGATTVTSSCAARTYKVTLDPKRYASASAQTGVEPDSTGTTAYWYRYKTKSPCYYYKVELNSASDEVASNCIAGTGGVTITPPTMAGYTFGGYYKSKPGTGTQYVTNVGGTTNNIYSNVAANSTLYAKWTAKTYTVTLNKNATDAVAGTASVTATYNAAMPTSSVTMPTRTGYEFAGYYDTSAATGGKQYYTSTGTSANNWDKTTNTTLYARWTADCNEITVDNTTRGGTTANTKLYKNSGDTKWYSDSSCQTVVTTTPRPSKTNATFSGYYTSATNTTTQVGTNANPSVLSTTWTVTEPTTIYAHYNCNTGWQEDGTDIAGTCIGTITATASDKVLTYNGTNGNNGTAQSCANVTVTTPASGASVTYATKTGTACGQYGNAPTLTNVNDGPKTICYKVTATNYETVTGEYTCSMNKANGNVVLSATTGSTVYPNTKTFTVTTNKSGGALSATPTSGNVVATASVSGTTVTATPQKTGTQTITVTSAETVNYNAATATYTLTVTDGGITHDVSDVSKTYDGTPLVCNGVTNVVPTSAEVKYRTATSGAYNLTSAPSITNVADSKTIYYQITADNYATVTGQFNCTVTKADCPITVKEGNTTLTSSSVVTLTYPTSKTLTATSSCGNAVTLSSGNTSYITVSDKTLNPVKVTSSDITMTASVAESANYNGATASFKSKVNRGDCSITLNPTSGSGTCASNTATFTIDKGSCNGTITASSSDEDIATVELNGAKTQGTVTRVSAGSATITVNVAQTDQYNATSAEYTFSGNKVAGSTTIKDGGTTVSSGSVAYPNTKTLTATCAGGATPTISNAGTTSVATATISNGTITMTPLKQGTSTITVSCPATDCYNASTATYKLTVNRGTCSVTLNPTSGTITYPTENTATFAINKGSCNGTITASSSDTNIATVALNSGATQGTVSYVAPGTATITVSSAQTDQYNAVSATYEVTNQLETYTITFKTGNKTMGTQSCTYGQNVTLNDVGSMPNIPVATNKGWGFDGWAKNVNTTNTDYANKGNMTCGGNVTLYGVWKRDVKFTYFETATSTANKTSTKQQYYRNTTTSAAGVSGVTTYPLYAQSDYAWSPLGWATTTGATSASISQTGATATTVTPGATTGTSAGVAYYAVYSRTPQIAYNGNGNTGGSTANTNCAPQTFNAGATNGSTPACTLANNGFTRTGYTFNKWAAGSATGDQYAASESYTFANKTWTSAKTYTMYANWSANTITLNFASEHGTAPASTTCSYGSTFNMPAAITGVVGYTFHRWNVNSNDFDANETGVACDNATLGVTSGSVTINATWKNNHYRILLDDNGGNGGQVAENSTWGMYEWYGQCYIAAQVLNNVDLEASTCLDYIYTAPTKQGYTFTGYYTENDEQVIAADKRVVGSPTLFEQNDTIYAHWTANSDIQYKVYHYTKNLGTNTYSLNGAVDTLYGVADSTVTLEDLARTITGFTYDSGFDGTATHGTTKPASGAVLTTTILPNGTRVIDLYYNRDTHTVTLSKGTGIASVTGAGTYEYGASVSINATMNNGYDWYRWTNTNTGAAVTTTKAYTFTMETSDIAYTANANVHSYTITYDLNQGTSSTTPVHGTNHPETYKVTDATFTISNPTMTGYTFAGWTVTTAPEGWGSGSSTSGSTNFKVGRGTYGNIAFRATWTANTYSIAYTLNGGAYGASHPASATFDAVFTVNNPTHEHATFSGWNISGMDTTTHTYGAQTTNATTLSGITATTFKNLRATAGTVTFTATWNCDTGYTGTNCDAIDYNMQYVCEAEPGWNYTGSAPVAANPVHYGQSVQLAGDVYAQTTGCRKVWGTTNDADYCDDCFTFGGWTIDAESTAIPTAPVHAANSTVNPWGRTNTTDWCIISDTGNCEGFADDVFYVAPVYTPKQYNIEYMYATSPVSGASANMPASYTYTTETTISNADQTAPAHATFNGWCTGANGTGTCVAAGQPITIGNRDHGDMRYYANWSCDTGYTLTYDANNQPVCSANTYNIDYVFNGGITGIPAEYTPVEYIQSNGSSYLNTGVAVNNNIGVYIDFQYANAVTSESILFGTVSPNLALWRTNSSFSFAHKSGTGNSYSITVPSDQLQARHSAWINFMNDHKIKFDETTTSLATTSFSSSKQLYIFAANYNGAYHAATARVYGMKISNGTDLIRDYIPVRQGNTCGLYDMVQGTYLSGSGFTCPNTEYTGGYPDSYTYGIGADITGVPTRAHSTFVGWCENSGLTNNCVTPQNVSTTAMGDKTFWAKWACNAGYTANAAGTACNPNTIALSYRNGGHGTAPTAPASCVYGENVNLPAAITATGYTFNKWAVADNNFAANATIVCNSANLGVTSGTAIITATWTTDSITCAAKKYLPAGATVCVDCIAGGYCPGGTYTYNLNLVQGITVCATNTYSNAAAAQCTACLTANGYQNSGDEFADHAYESSCKTTCAVGQCVATARAACANVGTTGWATGGVVAQGDTLACNVCQSGTSTCGYGACADEAGDCGRVLYVGANKLYLRSDRKTDRTLNVKIGNNIYYANMSPSNLNMSNGVNKSFKIKVGNAVYSVYDDSVGE